MRLAKVPASALLLSALALAQSAPQIPSANGGGFQLALPVHNGQLRWNAPDFTIVETSAKANGNEVGLRGQDPSGRLSFLAFLFVFPEMAPLTSAKCRDGIMGPEKQNARDFQPGPTLQLAAPIPVTVMDYSTAGGNRTRAYSARGFIATGGLCGDLSLYSDYPISAGDAKLKSIFSSLRLVPAYQPHFADIALYAQTLYQHGQAEAAAPLFERALGQIPPGGTPFASAVIAKRILTDQAGMSYGMAGNLVKARSIFEKAVADDPGYPLYYYNLACADAAEHNLADARVHLQQAFARRAAVIPGETMPDPTQDDSFLPFKTDPEFWAFLKGLQTGKR